jgi:hypothetical protein
MKASFTRSYTTLLTTYTILKIAPPVVGTVPVSGTQVTRERGVTTVHHRDAYRFCVVESNMGFLTELGIQDKLKYLFRTVLLVDSLAFARKQLLHPMNKANQRNREC